ncbi:hypothetical protein DdX_07011 [Ditylenchus destructor]|uniref:Uncharacterized protein n=1 Tax=Ditylenchus destructor TaxID=166010 RepID=A0AAD4R8K0_9BILA|nr:hypothetical protein DdX_07011 [Ditylenchus destructor]
MANHFSYDDVKAAVHALCSKSPLNAAKENEVTLKVAAIIMNRCSLELCLNAVEHINEDELQNFLNNTRLQLIENERRKEAPKKSAMKTVAITKPLKRKVSPNTSQEASCVFQNTISSLVQKSHGMVRRSSGKNTNQEQNEKEENRGTITASAALESCIQKELRNRTPNPAEYARKMVKILALCREQQMDPLEVFTMFLFLKKKKININTLTNVPKKVKFV